MATRRSRAGRARHRRHARHRARDRARARARRRDGGRHGDDGRGRGEDQPRISPTAGNAGTGMQLDVTDARSDRRGARGHREATSAPITILVNNAGITRDNLLLRMKDDEWDAIMATNLKPAFRLAKGGAARHDEGAPRPHHPDRHRSWAAAATRARRTTRRPRRRWSASPSRWRRKSAAATSPSTAWRRASSTPT